MVQGENNDRPAIYIFGLVEKEGAKWRMCTLERKGELSTGQATGQMANKRVYAFIFRKTPFLGGITVVYRRLLVFIDIPAYIADGFFTLCGVILEHLCICACLRVPKLECGAGKGE